MVFNLSIDSEPKNCKTLFRRLYSNLSKWHKGHSTLIAEAELQSDKASASLCSRVIKQYRLTLTNNEHIPKSFNLVLSSIIYLCNTHIIRGKMKNIYNFLKMLVSRRFKLKPQSRRERYVCVPIKQKGDKLRYIFTFTFF